jgi:hypothetical protein
LGAVEEAVLPAVDEEQPETAIANERPTTMREREPRVTRDRRVMRTPYEPEPLSLALAGLDTDIC